MKMSNIRVMVMDDHAILMAGVCMLLDAEKDITVVGQARTREEALELLAKKRPDVLLLDVSMPEEDGISLLPTFRKISPGTRMVMLTMYEDQHYLQKALATGASGFVLKKGLDVDLLYAIRAVMRNEVYIQPSMLKDLLGSETRREKDARSKEEMLWETLSPREREVMIGVAHGYTNKEIAEQYQLSEKTVATYRSRSMAKLGITTRAEFIELALALDILAAMSPVSRR